MSMQEAGAVATPLVEAADLPADLPPAVPPRPGHWTSVPRDERPQTPTFGDDVEQECDALVDILAAPGGGCMLLPSNGWDMVLPGIAIGEGEAAMDLELMRDNGFTHVLNTCEGTGRFHMTTGPAYYEGIPCVYAGFPADDSVAYDITHDFPAASAFLGTVVEPTGDDAAPVRPRGGAKVMVHCKAGASRSATVVLAYLVGHCGLTSRQAVAHVRKSREICPNNNFLKRLFVYEKSLGRPPPSFPTASACGLVRGVAAEGALPPPTVLCFGASLTEGLSLSAAGGCWEEILAPYTDTLAVDLGGTARVRNHGTSGQQAQEMADVLAAAVAMHGADVVVLLAGTNDLTQTDIGGVALARVLRDLHGAALAQPPVRRTIAVTVPAALEAGRYFRPRFEERRKECNEALRAWAGGGGGGGGDPGACTRLLDIEASFDPRARPELWCADGLHLSPLGYATLGHLVAGALRSGGMLAAAAGGAI